ncbi:MAG: hypothetical protein ACRCWM_02630 [Sarcina sp.]
MNLFSNTKETLKNFIQLNELISIDEEYLRSLEIIEWVEEGKKQSIRYKLDYNDENIKKIKENYPNLEIHDTQCTLQLTVEREPWNVASSVSVKVFLDEFDTIWLEFDMKFEEGI